ncbi:PDC sensor domain-containing protein [Niveispirillum irakense]|uniref:PDC sensor domain-containing protein n=1 Tax=Niveispirillum irakense TaxID=34011 RepID=UPI0012B5B515|nr:PDC sensor domain-containing protein [Niveispirillum irakense]
MALDRQWREEAGPGKGPLIDGMLTSPPSRRLGKVRLRHGALLADMMLIDSQGLLAAATRLTSDYIQGDETKYLETFPRGTGTIHIEAPHYDESVQDYVVMASIVLGDPADSRPLGVLTVTINLEMLKP